MATIAIPLVEFNDVDNKRTYSLATHSATKPSLLIQSRKVASASKSTSETTLQVVQATVDPLAIPLAQKISLSAVIRYPNNGANADLDLAIANFRAVVISDEFVSAIKAQTYIKP